MVFIRSFPLPIAGLLVAAPAGERVGCWSVPECGPPGDVGGGIQMEGLPVLTGDL